MSVHQDACAPSPPQQQRLEQLVTFLHTTKNLTEDTVIGRSERSAMVTGYLNEDLDVSFSLALVAPLRLTRCVIHGAAPGMQAHYQRALLFALELGGVCIQGAQLE
jgi:hypothetical protein